VIGDKNNNRQGNGSSPMTPDRNKTFAIKKDMVPPNRQQRPGTQATRESFTM